MLYWGYRSPWWLLHGDTLFDSGIGIEAASPSDLPAPYARDSVTQKLDQAQWRGQREHAGAGQGLAGGVAFRLGVEQPGRQGTMGGRVCDGHLPRQPVGPAVERHALALAAGTEANGRVHRLVEGPARLFRQSPLHPRRSAKNEPYGYCCTDGKRAFLALNNSCWKDSLLTLELNSAWGLSDGQTWDLYRWYPDAARLQGEAAGFGARASIALRPFEIVLLEVVPHGQTPSLNRDFESRPIPTEFCRGEPCDRNQRRPENPSA